MITDVRSKAEKLREDHIESVKKQDSLIANRVEERLQETQEAFIRRTEEASQRIFDENNKIVLDKLANTNLRVDDIEAFHRTSK